MEAHWPTATWESPVRRTIIRTAWGGMDRRWRPSAKMRLPLAQGIAEHSSKLIDTPFDAFKSAMRKVDLNLPHRRHSARANMPAAADSFNNFGCKDRTAGSGRSMPPSKGAADRFGTRSAQRSEDLGSCANEQTGCKPRGKPAASVRCGDEPDPQIRPKTRQRKAGDRARPCRRGRSPRVKALPWSANEVRALAQRCAKGCRRGQGADHGQ